MINDFLVAGEDGDNWRFSPEILQALVESYGGDRVSGLPLETGGVVQSVRLGGVGEPVVVELAADGSWLSISGDAGQCVDVALWVRRRTPPKINLNFFDSSYSFGHVPLRPETSTAQVMAAITGAE